jgi:hypothetical protein
MGSIRRGRRPPLGACADCSPPLRNPAVDDSGWEPDGVTFQVRFCEGGGPRGAPLLSHAAARAGEQPIEEAGGRAGSRHRDPEESCRKNV